jgi:hypothetical protein
MIEAGLRGGAAKAPAPPRQAVAGRRPKAEVFEPPPSRGTRRPTRPSPPPDARAPARYGRFRLLVDGGGAGGVGVGVLNEPSDAASAWPGPLLPRA